MFGFGVRFTGGLEELFTELDCFEVEEFPLAEDGAFGGSGEVFEAVFAVEESGEEGEGGLAASAGGFGVDDTAFLDEDAALDFGVKDFEDAGVTGGALEFDEVEEWGVGGQGGIALFGAPFEDFAERVMDALHAGEAIGFFEEEDGAVIEGIDAVFIGDGAGEEDFGDGGVFVVELADEFGAADAGHIHIDDDEVDILGLDEGVGLVGVGGGEDGPGVFAEGCEDIADHLEERGFVIDEEEGRFLGCGVGHGGGLVGEEVAAGDDGLVRWALGAEGLEGLFGGGADGVGLVEESADGADDGFLTDLAEGLEGGDLEVGVVVVESLGEEFDGGLASVVLGVEDLGIGGFVG